MTGFDQLFYYLASASSRAIGLQKGPPATVATLLDFGDCGGELDVPASDSLCAPPSNSPVSTAPSPAATIASLSFVVF